MPIDSKYTPGPWHYHEQGEANSYAITHFKERRKSVDWMIALLHNGEAMTEEQRANMQLIAAAPELLDALENLLDWVENQCGLSGNDECYGAFDSEEIVTASRLLERLKGEAHGC